MRPSSRQAAIAALLTYVENAIPTARIGNTSAEPVLWLPAPPGFAVWVGYEKGSYVAFISRRTGQQQMWHEYVGTDREPLSHVWPRISDWLNNHPELTTAWEAGRVQPANAPSVSTTPEPDAPSPGPADEEHFLPPGFDPESIRFYPLDVEPEEQVKVRVSALTASLVRVASSTGAVSESDIYEAGALMYLAHLSGRIRVLGGQEAALVQTRADQLQADKYASDPADALLRVLVMVAVENGLADKTLALFKRSEGLDLPEN